MNLGKSSDDMRRASGLRLPAEVGPEALEEVKETEVLETVVEDDVRDVAISIETEGDLFSWNNRHYFHLQLWRFWTNRFPRVFNGRLAGCLTAPTWRCATGLLGDLAFGEFLQPLRLAAAWWENTSSVERK